MKANYNPWLGVHVGKTRHSIKPSIYWNENAFWVRPITTIIVQLTKRDIQIKCNNKIHAYTISTTRLLTFLLCSSDWNAHFSPQWVPQPLDYWPCFVLLTFWNAHFTTNRPPTQLFCYLTLWNIHFMTHWLLISQLCFSDTFWLSFLTSVGK